jgi:multiple sugar transport system ATP-binding protein
LLNIIAGLETASEGDILIGDEVVNAVPPRDRDIAMVFQSYALYPTMTVRGNITFGLRIRGASKAEQTEAVERVASMLQIAPFLDRKPGQLSGGQRQRVAMGRALVRDPQIFLFDEPLSNLDAKLRVEMRHEIKALHRTMGRTSVYVTHDQVEAMTLATRIAVMHKGIIQQFGTPAEIYVRPANLFVAGFMGAQSMNFVTGTLVKAEQGIAVQVEEEGGPLVLPLAPLTLETPDAYLGKSVVLGMRPEFIGREAATGPRIGPLLERKVEMLEPTGADTMLFFRLGGEQAVARLPALEAVEVGESIHLVPDMSTVSLFDPATELRIPTVARGGASYRTTASVR